MDEHRLGGYVHSARVAARGDGEADRATPRIEHDDAAALDRQLGRERKTHLAKLFLGRRRRHRTHHLPDGVEGADGAPKHQFIARNVKHNPCRLYIIRNVHLSYSAGYMSAICAGRQASILALAVWQSSSNNETRNQ